MALAGDSDADDSFLDCADALQYVRAQLDYLGSEFATPEEAQMHACHRILDALRSRKSAATKGLGVSDENPIGAGGVSQRRGAARCGRCVQRCATLRPPSARAHETLWIIPLSPPPAHSYSSPPNTSSHFT